MPWTHRPSLEERLGPKKPNPSPISQKQHRVTHRGKIKWRLNEVARAKGLVNRDGRPNRAAIQRLTGMCDGTLYYLLRHPELTERIHFSTLARICAGLECTPGDLIEYVPLGGGETPLSEQYKADPSLGLES